MEPRIQYAKTGDDVNIAYYTLGTGDVTTFYIALPISHLEAEWRVPALRAAFTLATQDRTFVRYDARGFGLSDRDITDFSLDAMVSDVEAVTAQLGSRAVGFYALGFGSSIAVAYAARHPETTHLVLASPSISGSDFEVPRLLALIEALGPVDWELATESGLRSFFPGLPDVLVKELAGVFRASIDYEYVVRFFNAARSWDADQAAGKVGVRTLLIHDRQDKNADMRTTRRVAALIPDAQIAFTDGPFQGQAAAQEYYQAVLPGASGQLRAPLPAGTAIILFTDIADSTALTERMGDAAFRAAARALDDRMRAAIREAGGAPVEGKVLGDGVMAVFTSAAQAIDAARRCVALNGESELRLHVGLHAGDVIRERDNVYGGAVNIASRICGLSAPGEILVSATIRDLARTSAGVTFEDRGEHGLKGIEDGVRIFAVLP
jgi:class 3 adenylate cyclase